MAYKIGNKEAYENALQEAQRQPELFWEKIASENFLWRKKWDKVLEYDFSKAYFSWFCNAQLNITENCIDRHLAERGDKTALIFEPNKPNEEVQKISYNSLYKRVCQMANLLKKQGIKKGDRVCIYLPMIPELAISVLACARIGAIHSVVFAGFSAHSLATRITDCGAKLLITADGGYRGEKIISLKKIADEALENVDCIEKVLVVNRTNEKINMTPNRDVFISDVIDACESICEAETMQADDALFILYTSGSTGKPKGMVHSTAGYMVYTAYTFQNIFQYKENDVYWCTADIGWITGHSYILYGPLCNGATTVMFEGIPTYPDAGRFWEIIAKHKVNQFYTAPTAIRALAKEPLALVEKHDLSSLKIIGSVGEPINEEAWHWYAQHIGKNNCPLVDTWWQTETGGILISAIPNITKSIPAFATKALPGIQACLMNETKNEIDEIQAEGALCIKFPWPSIAKTIWGNHVRFIETYFSTFENKYFTGDGALRDAEGNYRITGRMDDVIIVSGHNLGTAPIEDAINEHEKVAESAVVGFPHDIKGSALMAFIILKEEVEKTYFEKLEKEINNIISEKIGAIAKVDKMYFVSGLPKTRSGKIMRRILRKIAARDFENLGDISTLLNPEVVEEILKLV